MVTRLTKNGTLLSREQKKHRLLALTRKALQTRTKNSSHLQTRKVFSEEIKNLNKIYTTSKASFGSVVNLQKESGLPQKKVEKFLQTKNSNTKYRQFRKIFPRLKVIAHRINKILSVDVAYIDKLAKHNNEVKCLLVTVAVLSRYLRVQPMKALYSKDAVEAFKKMIKNKIKNQRWYGQTKAPNSKEKSKDFLKKWKSFMYNRKRNQVGIC